MQLSWSFNVTFWEAIYYFFQISHDIKKKEEKRLHKNSRVQCNVHSIPQIVGIYAINMVQVFMQKSFCFWCCPFLKQWKMVMLSPKLFVVWEERLRLHLFRVKFFEQNSRLLASRIVYSMNNRIFFNQI